MKFNPLIPELSVSDFHKSFIFYTDILGFTVEYSRSDFAFISYQGSQFMIEQENSNWKTGQLEHPYGRGVNFQIETDEMDRILVSLTDHSYPIYLQPEAHWYRGEGVEYGEREFLVKDPDGYLLRYTEHIGERPIESTATE